MADMWSARAMALADEDLVDFTVHTRGGEAGTVRGSGYAGERAYLLIETRGDGRVVVVPRGVVEDVDGDAEIVRVACTREALGEAPEFDPAREGDADYVEFVGVYWGANSEGVV